MTNVLRKPIARRPASGRLTQRLHLHLSGRRTGLWTVMIMLLPLYALQSRTIRRSVLHCYPHSDIRLIILSLFTPVQIAMIPDIYGQKCHCFKQAIINTVYSQSNIREILSRENFSTLSFDYYSDEQKNPATGLSALATAKLAVTNCHEFIDNFENKPKNIFFYGNTGVGKTFLSNCIAKELLDVGYSVIYFTAFQLFDILSKGVFEKDADAIAAHQNIFDCDLLIIDDLGTELSNSFTTSQLFLCVNERILRQKSTIISTNLNLEQIADIYSERTLSRISSNYSFIKLFGDDIRIKKRLSK